MNPGAFGGDWLPSLDLYFLSLVAKNNGSAWEQLVKSDLVGRCVPEDTGPGFASG